MAKGNTKPTQKTAGRYHHGELREALLQAALNIVEEQGVNALTLRELTRRVGVSHAAPAHHFPDKNALLVALAIAGFQRFTATLQTAADTERDPAERLSAIGRAYVHFALTHPGYFRVMFGAQLAELKCPPEELNETGQGGYRILKQCVAELIGSADPARVQAVALAAWSFVHGTATLYLDGPLRFQLGVAEGRKDLDRWLNNMLPRMAHNLVDDTK